jgi:sugar lactone lactonase YvrE
VVSAATLVALIPNGPGTGLIHAGPGLLADPQLLAELGSSGIAPGALLRPYGVALDAAGNIYVTDGGTSSVKVFDGNGALVRSFGSPGSGDGQLSDPRGLVVLPAGTIVVADSGNDRIEEFDAQGGFQRAAGTAGSGAGQFQAPSGIAADAAGDLYVADTVNGRIDVLDGQLAYQRSIVGALQRPNGVAVDGVGNLYVTDSGPQRVEEYAADGSLVRFWGGPGTQAGNFTDPAAIALDPIGNVFVTETGATNRVQEFDPAGTFVVQWGGAGGGPSELLQPTGVVATASGQVYVADHLDGRVQRFGLQARPPGSIGAVAVVAIPGTVTSVHSVHTAVDAAGDLYLTDFRNGVAGAITCSLTKLDPAGATLWVRNAVGTAPGQFCGSNPGGSLNLDAHVVVDSVGTVYVKDPLLQRITEYDASGNFVGQIVSPHFKAGGPGIDPPNFWYGPMTFDGFGHLWSVDSEFVEMQELSTAGTVLRAWSGIGNATGIAADPTTGDLLVASNDPLVRRFSPTGTLLTTTAVPNLPFGATARAMSVGVDPAGHVVVPYEFRNAALGSVTGRIDALDATGALVAASGPITMVDTGIPALDVAFDAQQRIHVLDDQVTAIAPRELVFTAVPGPSPIPSPVLVRTIGSTIADGGFQVPQAIGFGRDGEVFVSTTGSMSPHSRIYRFDAALAVDGVFGGDCPLTSSLLCPPPANGLFTAGVGPGRVADGGNGELFVADRWNSRIQVFDSTGAYVRQFPTGPGPSALVIDQAGDLEVIVTDLDPVLHVLVRQIERYDPDGQRLARWIPSSVGLRSNEPDVHDLAIAPDGSLLVLTTDVVEGAPTLGAVQRFQLDGTLLDHWTTPHPALAMAVDAADRVFTYSPTTTSIDVTDAHGALLGSWSHPHLRAPAVGEVGIGASRDGRVFVTDPVDATVLVWTLVTAPVLPRTIGAVDGAAGASSVAVRGAAAPAPG